MDEKAMKIEMDCRVESIDGAGLRPYVVVKTDTGEKTTIACTREQAQAIAPHLYRKVRITIEPVE